MYQVFSSITIKKIVCPRAPWSWVKSQLWVVSEAPWAGGYFWEGTDRGSGLIPGSVFRVHSLGLRGTMWGKGDRTWFYHNQCKFPIHCIITLAPGSYCGLGMTDWFPENRLCQKLEWLGWQRKVPLMGVAEELYVCLRMHLQAGPVNAHG